MKKRCWGLEWRSRARPASIMGHQGELLLFDTRAEARRWADEHYGDIQTRADLRREPHCWRMPWPVRVVVTVEKEL